jgi:hypothetical protein
VSTGVAASPLSDAELTRAAQAGDAGSLGVLLARHEAAMRAVALGMIGYGPDTDDVVQDAALVAVRESPMCATPLLLARGCGRSYETNVGCGYGPGTLAIGAARYSRRCRQGIRCPRN